MELSCEEKEKPATFEHDLAARGLAGVLMQY
jgi:hypothetical protein